MLTQLGLLLLIHRIQAVLGQYLHLAVAIDLLFIFFFFETKTALSNIIVSYKVFQTKISFALKSRAQAQLCNFCSYRNGNSLKYNVLKN